MVGQAINKYALVGVVAVRDTFPCRAVETCLSHHEELSASDLSPGYYFRLGLDQPG